MSIYLRENWPNKLYLCNLYCGDKIVKICKIAATAATRGYSGYSRLLAATCDYFPALVILFLDEVAVPRLG